MTMWNPGMAMLMPWLLIFPGMAMLLLARTRRIGCWTVVAGYAVAAGLGWAAFGLSVVALFERLHDRGMRGDPRGPHQLVAEDQIEASGGRSAAYEERRFQRVSSSRI